MKLVKEIFEPIFTTYFVAIPLMFFILYISPALVFSKLVMGKYPEKRGTLDVVVSLTFSTGFWILIFLIFLL